MRLNLIVDFFVAWSDVNQMNLLGIEVGVELQPDTICAYPTSIFLTVNLILLHIWMFLKTLNFIKPCTSTTSFMTSTRRSLQPSPFASARSLPPTLLPRSFATMPSSISPVTYEIQPEGYAIVTICQEPVNAMGRDLWQGILDTVQTLEKNDKVQGVIFSRWESESRQLVWSTTEGLSGDAILKTWRSGIRFFVHFYPVVSRKETSLQQEWI